MQATRHPVLLQRLLVRSAVGIITLLLLMICGVQIAKSAEIIPSVGLTRAVDGDADAKVFAGLAVRTQILPFVAAEIGAGYRSEERLGDRLEVRMWPVTGSLYLTPIPALYAGAGVGWYHTTLDFDDDLPGVEDETRQEFGVHVGGGLRVPVAPVVGLDLGGRYVMMRDQDAKLVPEKFDPDFWVTSLGLALKF